MTDVLADIARPTALPALSLVKVEAAVRSASTAMRLVIASQTVPMTPSRSVGTVTSSDMCLVSGTFGSHIIFEGYANT
jgi:hypothetical protein